MDMEPITSKTDCSAVVMLPPAAVWEPIQAIRRQYDRTIHRWMPHLTLLYPFAPPGAFDVVAPQLAPACHDSASFDVTLTHFAYFRHSRRGATMYLAPEPAEPLVALQTRLWRTLPAYDDIRRYRHGFTPHLSFGQAPSVSVARQRIAMLAEHWQPLTFRVDGPNSTFVSPGQPS
jgi:RNA 2',3'-cyclic 3'-phosphodiesterase